MGRHKSRLEPKNNVHTLGFSDRTWEFFAQNANFPVAHLFIPISMQPLIYRKDNFKEDSRQKVTAEMLLAQTYAPDTQVEFLIGDTLFLDNHPAAFTDDADFKKRAQSEADARKKDWAALHQLPFSQLDATHNSLLTQYKIDPLLFPEVTRTKPNPSVRVSSWEKYNAPEIKEFMEKVRTRLKNILQLPNAIDILSNDALLFSDSDDRLGFVKHAFENFIVKELPYRGQETDQFKQFMASFAMSVAHHLNKSYELGITLPKNHSNQAKCTSVKQSVLQDIKGGEISAELKFVSSLSYLIHEFYYLSRIFITLPQAQQVRKEDKLAMLYGCLSATPVYHPIYQLNYFMEAAGWDSRQFISCSEFPLSQQHDKQLSSSNRGNSMMNEQEQQLVIPSSAPMPVPTSHNGTATLQTSNGSPTDKATSRDSSLGHHKSADGITSDTDGPRSASNSTSSHSSGNEKASISDEELEKMRKQRLTQYLTDIAKANVLGDQGRQLTEAAVFMLAASLGSGVENNASVGKTHRPSQSSANASAHIQVQAVQQVVGGEKKTAFSPTE